MLSARCMKTCLDLVSLSFAAGPPCMNKAEWGVHSAFCCQRFLHLSFGGFQNLFY